MDEIALIFGFKDSKITHEARHAFAQFAMLHLVRTGLLSSGDTVEVVTCGEKYMVPDREFVDLPQLGSSIMGGPN